MPCNGTGFEYIQYNHNYETKIHMDVSQALMLLLQRSPTDNVQIASNILYEQENQRRWEKILQLSMNLAVVEALKFWIYLLNKAFEVSDCSAVEQVQ